MNKDLLMEEILMDCPYCNNIHTLEKRKRDTQNIVKGEIIDYEEIYYLCPITEEEENEFAPAGIMDKNLLMARDAYRTSKGLLTSSEITEIRKFYELTQNEFSNLLGWGDITVTRYESKTIQDETYDRLMRMALENPLFTLERLEKNKEKFTEQKYMKIRKKVVERIEESGIQYLKIQEIKSIYASYSIESDYNGYKLLDLEKLADVIGYFAHSVNHLYRIKLMKLLWYADVLHYKRHGKSMMGLVYKHMTYGALPLAYDEIVHLPTVMLEEQIIYNDISLKIIPKNELNLSLFSPDELSILQLVSGKFKYDYAKEIVDYMHKEEAYRLTEPYHIISYELAKELNELE